MTHGIASIASAIVTVACLQLLSLAGAAQSPPASVEIAFVANAGAASVALVNVAERSVIATLDVNPARVESEGPGA